MEFQDLGIKEIKVLDSTPPEDFKAVNSMTMEAVVDVNPQPLRILRSFIQATNKIPSTLPPEARIVLQALMACFEKTGTVSEGLIGDVMFGFEAVRIAPELTYTGLKQLAENDYVKFQAKDNSWVDITSDMAEGAWVRYQPKLLDLVYE